MPVPASQIRMVFLDPETILDPSGENATEYIESLWPRRGGSISMPVFASQTRMVTSEDPEMILDPSGENATELIWLSWPRRGGRVSTPVLTSQTRMVVSLDPETMLDPSGENATEFMESSCPWSCINSGDHILSTPQTTFGRRL